MAVLGCMVCWRDVVGKTLYATEARVQELRLPKRRVPASWEELLNRLANPGYRCAPRVVVV